MLTIVHKTFGIEIVDSAKKLACLLISDVENQKSFEYSFRFSKSSLCRKIVLQLSIPRCCLASSPGSPFVSVHVKEGEPGI